MKTYLHDDDEEELRFNDALTMRVIFVKRVCLTWFCNETAIMMSYMHENVKLE